MKGKDKNKDRKEQRGDASYSENVRTKSFCCAFKFDFLQLRCKASLIFKSYIELALSIIFKEKELCESKHVDVECRCLKIRDLLFFFICFSILVLK